MRLSYLLGLNWMEIATLTGDDCELNHKWSRHITDLDRIFITNSYAYSEFLTRNYHAFLMSLSRIEYELFDIEDDR